MAEMNPNSVRVDRLGTAYPPGTNTNRAVVPYRQMPVGQAQPAPTAQPAAPRGLPPSSAGVSPGSAAPMTPNQPGAPKEGLLRRMTSAPGKFLEQPAGKALTGVGNAVKNVATSTLGKLGVAGMLANDANTIYNTPTADYEKRFGVDPNGEKSFLGDLAVRAGGAITDVANIGGVFDRFMADKQPASPGPQDVGPPAPAAGATAPAAAPFVKQPNGSVVGPNDSRGQPQGIFVAGDARAPRGPGVSVGEPGDAALAMQRGLRANAITQSSIDAQPRGYVTGIGSESIDRANAETDRANQLASLDRMARLSTSAGVRRGALENMGELQQGTQNNASKERIATQANEGETLRNQNTVAGAERVGRMRADADSEGNRLRYDADIYGADARSKSAAAQLAATAASGADERVTKRREFTRSMLADRNRKPDGSVDEGAVAGAMARVDELTAKYGNGSFATLPAAKQASEINNLASLLRISQPEAQGFFDELINGTRPRREGAPSLTGEPERVGLIRGAITPGVSRGDVVSTTQDGSRIKVANPTIEDIQRMQRGDYRQQP